MVCNIKSEEIVLPLFKGLILLTYNTLANQYTQIDEVHPKITHFKQSFGCTFCLITVNFQ